MLGVDLDRQRLGRRLHDHLGGIELDLAGGSLGFTVAASRATTLPVTVITLSLRSASAALKTGLETSTTHWVTP